MPHDIWQLGEVVADLGTQRVHRGGREFRLTPRSAAMLRALIETGDRPLSRDAALDRIWTDVATGDEVVGKAINELRQAFGDTNAAQRRYIETIPKLGYRLICSRTPVVAPASPVEPVAVPTLLASVPTAAADHVLPAQPSDAIAADGKPGCEAPTAAAPRSRWLLPAVVTVGVLSAAVATLRMNSSGASIYSRTALRTAVATAPRVLVPAADYLGYAQVFPDGSRALYATLVGGSTRTVAKPLGAGIIERIGTHADGSDLAPAVAHDGTLLAYQHFGSDGSCRIRLHVLAGGAERDLGSCSTRYTEWLEFAPDGKALLTARMRPGDTAMSLHTIDISDGSVTPLAYPRDPRHNDVQARYSPDGRWLAIRRGAQPHSALWLLDLARGRLHELVDDAFGLDGFAWLPDSAGLMIGVHDGVRAGLWRVDRATGQRDYLGLRGATDPVIAAANGTLVFCLGAHRYRLFRPAIDSRHETDLAPLLVSGAGSEWFPRLSADGVRLAFLSDRDGTVAVYVAPAAGGAATRMPDLPGYVPVAMPAFGADGRSLLVPMRGADGTQALYEIDLATMRWLRIGLGAAGVEQVLSDNGNKWIYYVAADASGRRLWRRSRETGVEQMIAGDIERGPIASDARGGVWYIDVRRQALLRRDTDGQVESWLDDMGYWTAYSWTVTNDGVYALLEPVGKAFGLYFVAADRTPVLVEPMDGIPALGLAVREGGRDIVVARPPRDAHDLVWLRLPAPARAH